MLGSIVRLHRIDKQGKVRSRYAIMGTLDQAHASLEKARVEFRKQVLSDDQILGKNFPLEIPFAPNQKFVTTF